MELHIVIQHSSDKLVFPNPISSSFQALQSVTQVLWSMKILGIIPWKIILEDFWIAKLMWLYQLSPLGTGKQIITLGAD